MSSEYIEKEIEKIMTNKDFEYPKNVAMATTWILGNLKGLNLKILDVQGKSSLADYFVLASASNPTQANSMSDQIQRHLKKYDCRVSSKEGSVLSEWTLLDLGDVIVHIFLENSREIFDLDGLWQDVPQLDIPNDYYHADPEFNLKKSDDEKSYF